MHSLIVLGIPRIKRVSNLFQWVIFILVKVPLHYMTWCVYFSSRVWKRSFLSQLAKTHIQRRSISVTGRRSRPLLPLYCVLIVFRGFSLGAFKIPILLVRRSLVVWVWWCVRASLARFWGFMPPTLFAIPNLHHSIPLIVFLWLPSDWLLFSYRCVDDLESAGVGISRVMFITQTLTLPSRPGCISWMQRPIQNAISRVNLGRCVELWQCYGSGACTTFFLFHGFGSLGFGLIWVVSVMVADLWWSNFMLFIAAVSFNWV